MRADKSQDVSFSGANADAFFIEENAKPVSQPSVEQIELATLLEELAEIIDAEDGILIP